MFSLFSDPTAKWIMLGGLFVGLVISGTPFWAALVLSLVVGGAILLLQRYEPLFMWVLGGAAVLAVVGLVAFLLFALAEQQWGPFGWTIGNVQL